MEKEILTKEEILEKLKENKDIWGKYGVKRIGLFGSYIEGDIPPLKGRCVPLPSREQKKDSDIDLLVEFDLTMFGKDFNGLFDAFTEMSFYMERLFARKIDILTPDSIRTMRIKEVVEDIERSVIYV